MSVCSRVACSFDGACDTVGVHGGCGRREVEPVQRTGVGRHRHGGACGHRVRMIHIAAVLLLLIARPLCCCDGCGCCVAVAALWLALVATAVVDNRCQQPSA